MSYETFKERMLSITTIENLRSWINERSYSYVSNYYYDTEYYRYLGDEEIESFLREMLK